MNFFIEKTGNNISEDAQYSEKYEKMVWMRQARIRMFMQLEPEACHEEIMWVVRCQNCEALNRPQKEYPARPLPIPPNNIDILKSRLIKVKQGILPPTLKMIINFQRSSICFKVLFHAESHSLESGAGYSCVH